MGQFDVHKNPRGGEYPLLLDVQAGVLEELATRVVVPMKLAKRYGKPITRLNPIARIGGTDYVLVFQELSAVPRRVLGAPVASLAPRRTEVIAALDLLFTGI